MGRLHAGSVICNPLSLAEAAILAGLAKRPSDYSPHRYPDRVPEKREWVLERMLALGDITAGEHADATTELLRTFRAPEPQRSPHR